MIEDFIKKAAGEIGLGEEQVSTATGGVLNLLKDHVDGGDFSSLLGALPGADSLMEQAAGAVGGESAAGGLGGLMGMAGKFLGGSNSSLLSSLGGAAGITSLLSAVNMDSGQLGNLASMFIDFAKENAGEELMERLMSNVPDEIKAFVA